jgi:hypothetical protein
MDVKMGGGGILGAEFEKRREENMGLEGKVEGGGGGMD